MTPVRVFLGWERPLCHTVPEWLLRKGGSDAIDLRTTTVVVPTRQSSWRLRAALPLYAQERCNAALLGPEIATPAILISPPPRSRRATGFQSLLAWSAVLRATPPAELDDFLGKQRPQSQTWRLQIARRLIGLRRELADGGLSINEVATSGKATEESARWQAMAEIEQRYLKKLQSWNLSDTVADQLAHAADGRPKPGVEQVILAAVPDPPHLLISLLKSWNAQGVGVTVLTAAPADDADAFDDWGRPLPQIWTERQIDLDDRNILPSANPEDQAARIAGLLKAGLHTPPASVKGQRPALAIGVADRETVAPLQRELEAMGLPAFDPGNRPFAETPLYRLLQVLLDWNERPGYAETAALLRHPDILAVWPDADRILRGLDIVQARHLPVTCEDLRTAAEQAIDNGPQNHHNRHAAPDIQAVRTALEWLAERRRELQSQPLADGLRAVLKAVYADRRLMADRPEDQAFQQAAEAIDKVLRELTEAEEQQQIGPETAAVLPARLQDMTLKPERGDEPLDLEGWLELAWNPAPAMYVAGVNEGLVPDSRIGDVFLPDTLRQKLGLRDDRLRVARDAYLLSVLKAQRPDSGADPCSRLVLLVGKRTLAGDPLRPSRLLFRCPDDILVQRARLLFADPPPFQTASAHDFSFKLDPSQVATNKLETRLPERISPTAFKAYLACPFRFYLAHILGMKSADDRAREPDALAFGNLCHAVVEAMGRDRQRIWACGDARMLGEWLEQHLRESATAVYGQNPWLGVTLTVESAARRLRAFALQQVAWHQKGWEIIEVEPSHYKTTLDGITIGGRIDRIDRNTQTGAVCLLDYKTTDSARQPMDTHLGPVMDPDFLPAAVLANKYTKNTATGAGKAATKRWIDLQLPLYREMVALNHGPDAGIGYILLPAAPGDTAFAVWDSYHDEIHAHALACALDVARHIRDGNFWPPAPRTPRYDDFTDLILNQPLQTFQPPPNPWRQT